MKNQNTKRWFSLVLILTTLLFGTAAQAVTPPSWKDTGFSINANGMTLRDVLNEFGAAYGVRVSISVRDQTVMKGRLKAENGSEFLDRLMHSHNFRWFVYSGTLYVVPRNDNISIRLEVGEDAVQDAKAALIGVGLFDSRFGWGELPDEGVVLVNGPREYVELARDVLLPSSKKPTFKGRQVMVFRLKYASAADRVINTRGQKEVIPGIKTILTGLLNHDSMDRPSDNRDRIDAASNKRSRTGKNGKGGAFELGSNSRASSHDLADDDGAEDTPRSAKSKPTREERPRIDADSSLNAIMIYDQGSKREMYQALISELDIEPQQIEIEALIVDIDRSKLSDLGIEWNVRKGNTVTTVNGMRSDSQGIELPLPGSTMLISNAGRFYARLRAMEDKGEAHVLAKPTVLTLDNVAAVLDLSQTAYVPLVGERVADLANITAGTMLRVVPRVVKEGASTRVRLEVDIEDGALGDSTLKSNVTRSTISTQAIIDMQQTLMIGGYHSESQTRSQQKIPVLGDAPLFGGLFRSTTESHSDRERLFLITPRQVSSTGSSASARSRAARAARAIAEAERDKAAEQDKLTEQQNKQVAPVSSTGYVNPGNPTNAVNPGTPANVPLPPPGPLVPPPPPLPRDSTPLSPPTPHNMSRKLSGDMSLQRLPRKPTCARPKLGFQLSGMS